MVELFLNMLVSLLRKKLHQCHINVPLYPNPFQYSEAIAAKHWNVLTHFSAVVVLISYRNQTSHLICSANQMTDFYMKCNIWILVLK